MREPLNLNCCPRSLGSWEKPWTELSHNVDAGSQRSVAKRSIEADLSELRNNRSLAFSKRCGEAGVRLSMGSAGYAHDNMMACSVFSRLEAELQSSLVLGSKAEACSSLLQPHKGFVQPGPAALRSGLSVIDGLRRRPRRSLDPGVTRKPATCPRARGNLCLPIQTPLPQ